MDLFWNDPIQPDSVFGKGVACMQHETRLGVRFCFSNRFSV